MPSHPNVVKAARPRYSAAQGKTDLGDAYLLSDLLRTDGHRFRALLPMSDETKALRALVRVHEFLDRYPTPQSASGLGEKRMAGFLARHSNAGRRTVAELVQHLRSASPSVAGELEAEAKGECVRSLVAVLRPLVAQLAMLSDAIEHAVEAHLDGKSVTPLFRSGRICVAQLLAELGDDRARFVSSGHLATDAGSAPVTRASDKHRVVGFR